MQAKTIKNQWAVWAVIVDYDGPYGRRGDVLSRHHTYEAARAALRRRAPRELGGWLAIEFG